MCLFFTVLQKGLPDVGSCESKHVVQYYVTCKCCVWRWNAVVCGISLCQQRHMKPFLISS